MFIWWVLICFFVGIFFSPLIFLCYHIPLRFLAGIEGPTDKGPAAPVDSRNWSQRLHSWCLLGAGMGHGGWVSSSWTFEVSASAWAEGDTNSPPFPDITSHAILQANSPESCRVQNIWFSGFLPHIRGSIAQISSRLFWERPQVFVEWCTQLESLFRFLFHPSLRYLPS